MEDSPGHVGPQADANRWEHQPHLPIQEGQCSLEEAVSQALSSPLLHLFFSFGRRCLGKSPVRVDCVVVTHSRNVTLNGLHF